MPVICRPSRRRWLAAMVTLEGPVGSNQCSSAVEGTPSSTTRTLRVAVQLRKVSRRPSKSSGISAGSMPAARRKFARMVDGLLALAKSA